MFPKVISAPSFKWVFLFIKKFLVDATPSLFYKHNAHKHIEAEDNQTLNWKRNLSLSYKSPRTFLLSILFRIAQNKYITNLPVNLKLSNAITKLLEKET